MFRKCYCMNNSYQANSCELQDDILETKCNNVSSYDNYEDSCGCGFDEEKSMFPDNPMLAQVIFLFNIWIKHLSHVLD